MTRVTVLTQADCALCDHAKRVLTSVARDVPLTVEEIALDSPEGRRMATEGTVLFAPGIFIDGQPFGYGRLSERKLRKALNTASHLSTRTSRP